ncbi:hypothetical protein DFH27DRAFT_603829 [Peziza echinospora]|nr:hypothetical protein DFH27DRAFT_603829 [Peziza echinospora]
MATIESDVSNFLNDPTAEPLPIYSLVEAPHDSGHSTSGGSGSSPASASSDDATSITNRPREAAAVAAGPSTANLIAALFTAITNTQDDVANHLLATYGPDRLTANTRNSEGKTPLAAAVETGSVAIVALLLNHGAEVDGWSCQGEYPVQKRIYLEEQKRRAKKLGAAQRAKAERESRKRFAAYQRQAGDAHGGIVDGGDPGISRPAMAHVSGGVESQDDDAQAPAPPLHPEFQILRTPLMLAAARGYLPLVQLLLRPPCNADPSLCAPDGQIALRLASAGGHREIVKLLPSLRKGGLKRFKHQHATSMYKIARTTHALRKLAVGIVWELPKAVLWRLPKWAAKKAWRVLRWVFLVAIPRTAKAIARTLKATASYIVHDLPAAVARRAKAASSGTVRFLSKTLPRFLARVCIALWIFFLRTLPRALVCVAKWHYRFLTKTLPRAAKWFVKKLLWKFLIKGTYKAAKGLLKFLWRCLTVHFPQFARDVGERLVNLATGTYHLLKRGALAIVSLVHTILTAVFTFFRRISLQDILNGAKDVGRWVFVEVPAAIGKGLVAVYEGAINAFIKVFGFTGEVIVVLGHMAVYVVVYIPVKAGQVLVEYGRAVRKGAREVILWVNPKAMITYLSSFHAQLLRDDHRT